VSLSCYTCSTTTATAIYPSHGCTFDVGLSVTYPDGSQSPVLNIIVNTPKNTVLQAGYPFSNAWYPPPGLVGYYTEYPWDIYDLCSEVLSGLEVNETFGTWSLTYPGSTWSSALYHATAGYNANSTFMDTLGTAATNGALNPNPQIPQMTPGSVSVIYDYPWQLYVGSQTFGQGTAVHADTQEFWRDHGTHSVP
jgi:hypothetical protein